MAIFNSSAICSYLYYFYDNIITERYLIVLYDVIFSANSLLIFYRMDQVINTHTNNTKFYLFYSYIQDLHLLSLCFPQVSKISNNHIGNSKVVRVKKDEVKS